VKRHRIEALSKVDLWKQKASRYSTFAKLLFCHKCNIASWAYLEQHIMSMNANEAHNKGFFNL
jgi:hypothetical protein